MLPLLPLLLTACPDGKDEGDGDGDAPPINQGDDTAVGTNAPEVESVSISECVYDFADEGEQPAIFVVVHATDADADIHLIRMSIWWDATIDETVDVAGTPMSESDVYQVSDEDGNLLESADEVNFGTYLNVNGDETWLEYETEYEFAVVVYDAQGNASEPGYATYTTPPADLSGACD
ncbi:MAG: hypothetical protein ACOZNI_01990 [Myxococcota bacterium]